MSFTIGSLFDGSGGFPLAASLAGGVPVWASEVEPYPIAVTRSRFPQMRHLGDISKINGAEIEPVDVITFGSPCQDLSVAGKRAGLKHESAGDEETTRSGLFMEAARIIKEMRAETNGRNPTYAVWENVPGAFSSNSGEDFRTVLAELIKIVEPCAVMPAVPKNGWAYADCYVGDGWSLAYRVFDAQYWGVPQRRRRIHLVLDLRGERARKILFEREGVRGYFAQGSTPWQGTAADAQSGIGTADRAGTVCVAYSFDALSSNSMKSKNPHSGCRQVEIAKTLDTTNPCPSKNQGGIAVVCYDARDNGDSEVVPTLTGDHENRVTDYTAVVCEKQLVYCLQGNGIGRADTAGYDGKGWREDQCYTLNTIDRPAVAYANGNGQVDQLKLSPLVGALNCMHDQQAVMYQKTCGALCARDYKGVGSQYVEEDKLVIDPYVRYIVRRLTPTECARLQGFPDRWGDIEPKTEFTDAEYAFWLDVRNTHAAINDKAVKEYTKDQMLNWYNKLHTDSAEYKMWGNGIALPPALYVMQGIADAFAEERGTI